MFLDSVSLGRLRVILGVAIIICFMASEVLCRTVRPASKEAAFTAYRNRMSAAQANPTKYITAHTRGKIHLAVANNGTFGTFGDAFLDPFTGKIIPSCVYPRGSDLVYLWVGAFWIGAIVGRDTLVSCGSEDYYATSEFWPEAPNLGGKFTLNSIDINSKFHNPNSWLKPLSEQDIYTEYYDTTTNRSLTGQDDTDGRGHKPLGIKVSQRSMAWSYDYADDFILFDYEIENIGKERLKKVYMGIWVDGDIWPLIRRGPGQGGWDDDCVGFLATYPAPEGCGFIDTINVAYHLDNDGDPVGGAWNHLSPRSAVGVKIVRTPSDSMQFSFNWWIVGYENVDLDFGPRKSGSPSDPFRKMGRLGTPEGDKNKYYILSHNEFDYDTYYTSVDQSSKGWLPPPAFADDFANGYDSRYLLSFGPFDIEPGQKLPISFAWVGGEDVHVNPNAFEDLFDPNNPTPFYRSLDFSSLALNSRWASWVYDNPGVDTDGDGFFGHGRVCSVDSSGKPGDINDTIDPGTDWSNINWYKGDGVPDFKGAGPPPAPLIKVYSGLGKITVRWNGYYSETTNDVFLGIPDFEGYRVYAGLDERDESFTIYSSYDIENYNRFRWNDDPDGIPGWVHEETPFTIDSLRSIFNDPILLPLDWSRNNPYVHNDELYFFDKQDFNDASLTSPNGIRKVYPEITERPPKDPLLWTADEITYEHGEALPKYYEYEYVLNDLLPTIPYFVAVTSFDFGSPVVGLPALEVPPVNNHIVDYPQVTADSVDALNLPVYTYPNPYRIDQHYRASGYEGRQLNQRDRPDDRVRQINFANLPRVCKISIFTLDGDLVRELDHNFPEGGPMAGHDSWDLITRNTQLTVSGLYFWVVESENGTQIGKFAIIE